MSEQARVLRRMVDVTISLATASRYDEKLNRIRLQKFIYLLDIVGYMYEVLPPSVNHISYNNGPYDAAIQNAVDSLAFRGFVEISDFENLPNGRISCSYSLTSTGQEWAAVVANKEELNLRFEAACAVGEKVDRLGWWRLKDLVYAEPTYVKKRYSGFGQKIDITNGIESTASYLIGLINRSLKIGKNSVVNRELAVDVFFKYLNNYDLLSREELNSSPARKVSL